MKHVKKSFYKAKFEQFPQFIFLNVYYNVVTNNLIEKVSNHQKLNFLILHNFKFNKKTPLTTEISFLTGFLKMPKKF